MINLELPDSWKKVNLGSVLSYIGNGLTDKQNKVSDGYPVTRIETISDDCINADKVGYISTLPEDKIEKSRLCYGDMLVSHINSDPQLGRSVIYEGNPEFLLHGMNLLRMRANTKLLAPFFLNLIFRFYRNRGVFIALASRAVGQSSINQSRMKSLIIPLPLLPEQRAIAHVLGTIQEAKAARQRELALERERKAALMDHLFSYGTRGEPRKQTEIGEIPESWEVVKFAKTVEIAGGQIDPRQEPYRSMIHVGPENIESGTGRLVATNTNADLNIRSGNYYFAAGEILYSKIRPYLNKAALPEFEGTCSADVYPLRPYKEHFERKFLFQFLLSKQFNTQAISHQNRTGIPKINRVQLGSVFLLKPPLSEQAEIAEILQACDTKIAVLEQEAERLDELFHAMLDELMTGKRSAVPLIDAELPN